jgi:16S rRNA processing protein RimM
MRGSTPRSPGRKRPAEASPDPAEYLIIGVIVAPRGLQGELKVRVETDDPDRFEALEWVYVGPERQRYGVEGARLHRGSALLRLSGITDRDAAEELRGAIIYVDTVDALPLGEGEYFHHQIEGLRVVSESGEELGRLREVLETGANDVYVVIGPKGEILLPAIQDVILMIDVPGGTMTVRVPEGLI